MGVVALAIDAENRHNPSLGGAAPPQSLPASVGELTLMYVDTQVVSHECDDRSEFN